MIKNINTLFKVLALSFCILLFYWIISIAVGQTDANGHHNYFYANWGDMADTKEEAKQKKILINDKKMNIEIEYDSIGIFDSIDFWLSKRVIHNKYGFLPLFHFIDTSENYCDLNSKYGRSKSINYDNNNYIHYRNISSSGVGSDYLYKNFSSIICKLPSDTLILEYMIDKKNVTHKVGKVKLYW